MEESDDEVQHGDEPIDNSVSPYFEIKLKHYKIFEGMPVTFTCKVAGNPKPKVRKDGRWFLEFKSSVLLRYHQALDSMGCILQE